MKSGIRGNNSFDLYLFLLIASLVAGNLFGALQVPRVLAIVLFFPCLNCFLKMWGMLRDLRNWALLFIAYSIVSSIWNPAGISEGLISSVYNAVHFTLFFEIIVFSRFANNPIKAIVYGFLIAFAISAVIAFWELTTDQHLNTSKFEEAQTSNTGYDIYVRYFAAVTFYNFNMYVTFICFLLPFLFYGVSNAQNKGRTRIVFAIATALAVVLLIYNGSRGGLLAFLIMVSVYVFFTSSNKRTLSVYFVLFLAVLGFVLYRYGSTILNTLIMRGEVQGIVQEESRFVIWGNVWKVVQDYYFLGCGAGGLRIAMAKYVNRGILMAHNVFLEVLSEYGIVFFIGFLMFLITVFNKAKKLADKQRKLCLYQALLAFPVYGIINSGYLNQPVLWAAMASLYVFANYEQIKAVNLSIR